MRLKFELYRYGQNEKQPFWFSMVFDFMIGYNTHKQLILQYSGEARNVTGSKITLRKRMFKTVGL